MLMAADVELPRQVFAHGFLAMGEGRLSRSSGNMIDPLAAAKEWGADAIRYLLLRDAPFEKIEDSPVSPEQFNTRFNADLANGLGNLVSRTLKMVESYCGGVVPRPDGEGESEIGLHALANHAVQAHDDAAAQRAPAWPARPSQPKLSTRTRISPIRASPTISTRSSPARATPASPGSSPAARTSPRALPRSRSRRRTPRSASPSACIRIAPSR